MKWKEEVVSISQILTSALEDKYKTQTSLVNENRQPVCINVFGFMFDQFGAQCQKC